MKIFLHLILNIVNANLSQYNKLQVKPKRILLLLKDIERNGYEGIGKPERLSGDLSAYWSRRIDDSNHIVYRIENEIIKIVQCGSHYRDK